VIHFCLSKALVEDDKNVLVTRCNTIAKDVMSHMTMQMLHSLERDAVILGKKCADGTLLHT